MARKRLLATVVTDSDTLDLLYNDVVCDKGLYLELAAAALAAAAAAIACAIPAIRLEGGLIVCK